MFVLGIDVSKDKLDCYISSEVEEKPKRSSQFQIENSSEGFEKLGAILSKKGLSIQSFTVVLEPTNTYHVELIYWLHAQKAAVCLANPKDTHHYAKSLGRDSKTDRLDCFAIAQFGLTRKLHIWKPSSKNIRQLDALVRERTRIVQDRQREENRLDSLPYEEKKWVGVLIQKAIDLFRKLEAKIDEKIEALIARDKELSAANKRLQTIPTIGKVIAPYLIVLFSNGDFQNGEQAAAFCGVIPKEYQSGSSIKGKVRMTKRGPGKLRAALRMAVTSILCVKTQSSLTAYYNRLLAAGKTKTCALGALAHKVIVIAFAIWRDKTVYRYA